MLRRYQNYKNPAGDIDTLRDSPQAKLDNEINARYLSNRHGNLYFLLHYCGEQIILFQLKK